MLGWELRRAARRRRRRGVALPSPSWTPYEMTPVDSSSKGTYYTTHPPRQDADNIQSTYWLTAGNPNEYVSFDFGQHRTFDHLQLTIYSGDDDLRNPRNVRFEVWDGSAWKVVHQAPTPTPRAPRTTTSSISP